MGISRIRILICIVSAARAPVVRFPNCGLGKLTSVPEPSAMKTAAREDRGDLTENIELSGKFNIQLFAF